MVGEDLEYIKKHYGEKFAKLCRSAFPTILAHPGFLKRIITKNFAPSRFLYDDIVGDNGNLEDFKSFIMYSFQEEKRLASLVETQKTPSELLKEKGYTLYECKTYEDTLKFKKYYADNEKLCTFNDRDRTRTHYVFFIVRDDAETVQRQKNPRREDEYSLSVLSLQFTKGQYNDVSIKSRYNHTVENPDAVYLNNLDKIVPGLADSFKRAYYFKYNADYDNVGVIRYVPDEQGCLHKTTLRDGNYYCGPNNFVFDKFNCRSKFYDRSRYDIIDGYILDRQQKTIKNVNPFSVDSFPRTITNIRLIERTIDKSRGNVVYKIVYSPKNNDETNLALIAVDEQGRIVAYYNDGVTKIDNNFMCFNDSLKRLDLPKTKVIGNNCLYSNYCIEEVNIPETKELGSNFLFNSYYPVSIHGDNILDIGAGFMFESSYRESVLDQICPFFKDQVLSMDQEVDEYGYTGLFETENVQTLGEREVRIEDLFDKDFL